MQSISLFLGLLALYEIAGLCFFRPAISESYPIKITNGAVYYKCVNIEPDYLEFENPHRNDDDKDSLTCKIPTKQYSDGVIKTIPEKAFLKNFQTIGMPTNYFYVGPNCTINTINPGELVNAFTLFLTTVIVFCTISIIGITLSNFLERPLRF